MCSSPYVSGYNELISDISHDLKGSFPAIASPTLSKQETVSFLHQLIQGGSKKKNNYPSFPWRRMLEFVPRIILMFFKVIYASVCFRVKEFPENAVVFKTWLVPRSVSGGKLVDDYFRQLTDDLESYENVVTCFSSTDIKLLRSFANIEKKDNQILSYGLLSLLDVFKLFGFYLTTALVQSKRKYYLEGENVTRYINYSLLLDYLELRSFEAYAELYKCNNLIKYNIKAYVYVYENQSWEKACCATLRKSNIRLIGYQSSGFSPIFLNFFPTEKDSKFGLMPDVVLTVGEYFRRYLLEFGSYSIPVDVFAALRFSYAIDHNHYSVLDPNIQVLGRVLYAFPVHIGQYVNIINDLAEVFQDSRITVDLKLHPLYNASDINIERKLPDNFHIIADVNMNLLRDTYDCVLFNDNSFGIEAMLQGVKSYQYSKEGCFSDDRFMYFDLWKVNYRFDDLHQLKNLILSKEYNKEFIVECVSSYINGMYKPYRKDSLVHFLEVLNDV